MVEPSIESKNYEGELDKPENNSQVKNILEDNNAGFVILLNTFQYLSVPDLLIASQVSKLWYFVCSHNMLWKKIIILKNCRINNYNGLCKKVLKHGTQELDIADAVADIPDGMAIDYFWRMIFRKIKKMITLKKVKLGLCPRNSVSMIARAAPQLRSFSFSLISDRDLNLAPLSLMHNLEELTLKGTEYPVVLTNACAIKSLINLKSLSLKKIVHLKELVNYLPIGLRSLEIGWYSKNIQPLCLNGNIDMSSLSKLVCIKNLSLSDDTELGIFLTNTIFLKSLNELVCLKLYRVYSSDLLENLPTGLRSLTFDCINVEVDLRALSNLKFLNVLVITNYSRKLFLMNAVSINSLKHLTSLTLKGIKNLNAIGDFLPPSLESLELGNCYSLSSDFITKTLPRLIILKRLELENGFNTFETTELLNAVAVMPNLTDLSLINVEFKRGFHTALRRSTNLVSLQISPYCSWNIYSLTIHQKILFTVASLKETLKYFRLGFDCNFIILPTIFDQVNARVWFSFRSATDERVGVLFLCDTCPCSRPCDNNIHLSFVGLEFIENSIFPLILPKTRASIYRVVHEHR